MDRVYNVEKTRKRKASDSVSGNSDQERKRGRPKKSTALGSRYPAMRQVEEPDTDGEQALKKEMEQEKPRKDVVLSLMKNTFYFRRQYILHKDDSVRAKLEKYPALRMPYVVRTLFKIACMCYVSYFVQTT